MSAGLTFMLLFAKFVGFLAGQTFPKTWVAKLAEKLGKPDIARHILRTLKNPRTKRITTIPRAIKVLMLKPGNRNLVLKTLGRTASPLWTFYGLSLASVEIHCAVHCAKNCNYNPQSGNIKNIVVNTLSFH